jgi:superfamily II DNA or RNA helicase
MKTLNQWLVVWDHDESYRLPNLKYDTSRREWPKNPKRYDFSVRVWQQYYFPKGALWYSAYSMEYADKFAINVDFNGTLNDDQQNIVDQLGTTWLIIAPTGWGKSWAIAGIINKHQTRTLVVAPKVEIAKWLLDKFNQIFGEGKASLFKAKKENNSDIVVIVGNSFNRYYEQLSGNFWQLIIDEAHMNLVWPDRRKALCFFRCGYFFGLTGTPESQDVEPKIFNLIYGTIHKAKAEVNECKIFTYKHFEKIDTQFWEGIHAVIDELQGKYSRTSKIIAMIKRVMAKRNMGIVFCDRIEFVETLVRHLSIAWVYAEAYTGATKDKEEVLKRIESRHGVMVVTRSSCGVGFDCPSLDTGFYLSALKYSATTKQLVGRILRNHPWKQMPVLIDRQDSIFKWQYEQRMATYAETYKTPVTILPHDFV